jgi:hypothetical protein
MALRRSLLFALIVLMALAVGASSAAADTATLPAGIGLPWTDPNHQSPLENLLAPIASTIANRQVTVHCEGDYDWATLVHQSGLDPAAELGYVTAWFWPNGTIANVESFTELSPTVCLALQQFAQGATKPSKCTTSLTTTTTELVLVTHRVAYKVRIWKTVNGVRKRILVTRHKTVSEYVKQTSTTTTQSPLAPCYDGTVHNPDNTAYWNDYFRYAQALLALAHESIHLGGYVGGVLPSGVQAGYPDAEARANCFGMQWMPYVAQQLGATPDDALDIARYFYRYFYPRYNSPSTAAYWSPDCRPGGALDIHLGPNIWS